MNSRLKIILVSIGTLLLSVLIADIVFVFVILRLNDYFIHELIAKIDLLLLRYFPLLIGGFFLFAKKDLSLKELIKVNLMAIVCIYLFVVIGYIVAILTWSPLNRDYLPSRILIQPFRFYWTPFILAGIILPIYLKLRKRKRINHGVIDDEV